MKLQESNRSEAQGAGREGKEIGRIRSAIAETQGANGSIGEIVAKGTYSISISIKCPVLTQNLFVRFAGGRNCSRGW